MTTAHFSKRLLIAEDDSNFRRTVLSVEFAGRGYDVTTANSLRGYRALDPINFDYAAVNLKQRWPCTPGRKISNFPSLARSHSQ
jgi:ActR/RegA family two-component response regulator